MCTSDDDRKKSGSVAAPPGEKEAPKDVAVLIDGYPQLCGLCSHIPSVHTPDRCKVCGNAKEKLHEYVRADVLMCTQLHEVQAMMQTMMQQQAFIGKALVKLIEVMERVAPDPKKPRLVLPQ
jgi:hypothetical protein